MFAPTSTSEDRHGAKYGQGGAKYHQVYMKCQAPAHSGDHFGDTCLLYSSHLNLFIWGKDSIGVEQNRMK